MKKEFTKSEIISNRGCYERRDVLELSFINKYNINIFDIIKSEMPLKDKIWFLFEKSEILHKDKIKILITICEIILPIYEIKYPDNKFVRECIEFTILFNIGEITIDELIVKKNKCRAASASAADANNEYVGKIIKAILIFIKKY